MILEHLKSLRNDWSEEIPPVIVHSDCKDHGFPNKNLKVRKNWFVGIKADVSNLLEEGLITDAKKIAAAQEIISRLSSKEFIDKKLTEPKDIQITNKLIDIILKKNPDVRS